MAEHVDDAAACGGGTFAVRAHSLHFETAATQLNYPSPQRVFNSPSLRQILAGRWVYVFGDSSSRGLFLSLYQQLTRGDGFDPSDWLGVERNIALLGFADAIVSNAGDLVNVRSARKHKVAVSSDLSGQLNAN